MKDLSKYYPGLRVDERFKLMLSAFARGDDGEVRRLKDTCPKKIYEMTDGDFADRMQVSKELIFATATDWLYLEMNLLRTEMNLLMYSGMMDYLRRGYALGAGRDINVSEGESEHREHLSAEIRQARTDLKSCLVALEVFADRIDVPLDTMILAWNPPLLEWVERHRPGLEGMEPDAEMVERRLSLYCKCWQEAAREDISEGYKN
jgi:hypothetical protein